VDAYGWAGAAAGAAAATPGTADAAAVTKKFFTTEVAFTQQGEQARSEARSQAVASAMAETEEALERLALKKAYVAEVQAQQEEEQALEQAMQAKLEAVKFLKLEAEAEEASNYPRSLGLAGRMQQAANERDAELKAAAAAKEAELRGIRCARARMDGGVRERRRTVPADVDATPPRRQRPRFIPLACTCAATRPVHARAQGQAALRQRRRAGRAAGRRTRRTSWPTCAIWWRCRRRRAIPRLRRRGSTRRCVAPAEAPWRARRRPCAVT
jgi:hypothetical protein